MSKWLMPTISEVVMLSDPAWATAAVADDLAATGFSAGELAARHQRAEREWQGAIAALELLLRQKTNSVQPTAQSSDSPQGLLLSGPLPVLSDATVAEQLSTWTLSASAFNLTSLLPFRLLPGHANSAKAAIAETTIPTLPLIPGDPLALEQFCVALTPHFSLVMVLGKGLGETPTFAYSFLPEVAERAWEIIRPRILMLSAHQLEQLDELVQAFVPIAPDYHTVMQFSRWLLERMPEPREAAHATRSETPQREVTAPSPHLSAEMIATAEEVMAAAKALDVELLQAIAHEVRTPLTTIRTLTRSLLRRKDLPASVIKRLESIDRECSEQIDRFGLIFRAVELETTTTSQSVMSLTRTSLAQVFQQVIPQWQQQATQRGLVLDVVLPPIMPVVVSDPTLLDKALTSLIERFTRNLPAGSHIQVDAALAGDQLKLQLQSQVQPTHDNAALNGYDFRRSPLKSLGQMLTFQPETGSLSLNLAVTKNLFQSLGGKLTVRERPQQGEIMTVYLPLEGDSHVIEV